MRLRLVRFRRRLRTRLIAAGLSLAVAITILGLVSATLSRAAPSWWRQFRPTPELRERATAVENAAISRLYAHHPPDPAWLANPGDEPWRSAQWSIALKDEDASAWLTARLPEWVDAHAEIPRWPVALGRPQVRFETGLVRIGVTLRRDDGERVLTASVRPVLREDGSLWLRAHWIHVGRLPIPATLLLNRVGERLDRYLPTPIADDPHSAGFIAVLRGRAPLAVEPTVRLEDGRLVRLVGLRVTEGRIEIDCRTESRTLNARN